MRHLQLAILLLAATTAASAQKFEVISVKPYQMPPGVFSFYMSRFPGPPKPTLTGNRFTRNAATLQDLLMVAYEVMDYQIAEMPDWAKAPNGDHFEIDATIEAGTTPTTDELRAMLRNLLEDRFQLKIHRETRDLPVYILTVAKGGAKLKEISDEEAKERAPTGKMRGNLDPSLTGLLKNVTDRPVLDRTGLKATYEFQALDWRALGIEHREDPTAAMSTMFTALQDQLGLKLEAHKEPLSTVVIDHVGKPSTN